MSHEGEVELPKSLKTLSNGKTTTPPPTSRPVGEHEPLCFYSVFITFSVNLKNDTIGSAFMSPLFFPFTQCLLSALFP